MNRAALLAASASVATAGVAHGQIHPSSQQRSVAAGSQSFVATNYLPFYQSASDWIQQGVCLLQSPTSAMALHESSLGSSTLSCSLLAESRGIGSSASFAVEFTADAGTAFTFTGSRRRVIPPLGGAGCCLPSLRLVGPGVNILGTQDVAPSSSAVPYSFSGTLAGGVYFVSISATSQSVCAAGMPALHLGEASGLLSFTSPRCRTDQDADGQVTPADVAFFVQTWLTSLTSGTLAGDFDGNGIVQPADIALFVQAWFAAASGGATC